MKSGYRGPFSRKYYPEATNHFCEVCLQPCSNWASGSNWASEWDSGLRQRLNVCFDWLSNSISTLGDLTESETLCLFFFFLHTITLIEYANKALNHIIDQYISERQQPAVTMVKVEVRRHIIMHDVTFLPKTSTKRCCPPG